MCKVNEKLTQISTLATDRLVADTPPKPRGNSSPTGTDSSSSTLREDGSIENLSSLVSEPESARDTKAEKSREVSSMKVDKPISSSVTAKVEEPQLKSESVSRGGAVDKDEVSKVAGKEEPAKSKIKEESEEPESSKVKEEPASLKIEEKKISDETKSKFTVEERKKETKDEKAVIKPEKVRNGISDLTDGVKTPSGSRPSSRASSTLETRDYERRYTSSSSRYQSDEISSSPRQREPRTDSTRTSGLSEGRASTSGRDYSPRSTTLSRYSSALSDTTSTRDSAHRDTPKYDSSDYRYKSATLDTRSRRTDSPLGGSSKYSREYGASTLGRGSTATPPPKSTLDLEKELGKKLTDKETSVKEADEGGDKQTDKHTSGKETDGEEKAKQMDNKLGAKQPEAAEIGKAKLADIMNSPKLSPKSPKHRPVTPEPLSPDPTNAKLLQSPERRTRRKSEGMKPIAHHLGLAEVEARKSETLHEEEDEGVTTPTSTSAPPDTGVKSTNEKQDEVRSPLSGKKKSFGIGDVPATPTQSHVTLQTNESSRPTSRNRSRYSETEKYDSPSSSKYESKYETPASSKYENSSSSRPSSRARSRVVSSSDSSASSSSTVPSKDLSTAKSGTTTTTTLSPAVTDVPRPSSRVKSRHTSSSESARLSPTPPSQVASKADTDTVRPNSRQDTARPSSRQQKSRHTSSSDNLRLTSNSSPTPPVVKSDTDSTTTYSRPGSRNRSRHTSSSENLRHSANTSPTPPGPVATTKSGETSEGSRPGSRTRTRDTSEAKPAANRTSKPSSPTSSRPLTSKYTSCTENAFTSKNSPFAAAETRPYTSVLRPSSSSSRSLSSLTRSPVDQAWRESSSSGRRLSATPIRGHLSESSDVSSEKNEEEKYRRKSDQVIGNRPVSPLGKQDGRVSPKSASPTKVFFPAKEKVLSEFSSATPHSSTESSPSHVPKSPLRKTPPSVRRGYVKREQTLIDRIDERVTSPLQSQNNTLPDPAGPEIIVRAPSVSNSSKNTKEAASIAAGVKLREKPSVPNHLQQKSRASWRQTPVISPDVVDMILKGEIFDADAEEDICSNLYSVSKKLEMCVEEEEPVKKFSPTGSRSGSRTGNRTPILKTSKSNSPDQTPPMVKRVSIDSDSILAEDRNTRPRRKFLSSEERSHTLTSLASPSSALSPSEDDDRVTSPPDPLSTSMDMRGVNQDFAPRLRVSSLSHSQSTPDLTELLTQGSKKGAKAKRVERSNSKRLLGRIRVDTYVSGSSGSQTSGDIPLSPRHRSGTASFSPRHSGSSLSSRILAGTGINRAFSSFSRRSERDRNSESRSRGSRTLK